MRVLIVEDENALRDSLAQQLKAAGFNVDVAADGEEGLYCGREYPLDLAVIDLGLPKVPGLEVIKKLRADGEAQHKAGKHTESEASLNKAKAILGLK